MPVFGTSANLIVLFGLAQIASARSFPTFVGRDVERGRELHVADVVAAEVDVHEPGDELVRRGVLVVLDSLEERVGAVADADDRDADLAVPARLAVLAAVLWHWFLSGGDCVEPLGERVDDDGVRAASALARGVVEPALEGGRDAQEHVAALAGRRGAPAARREVDVELVGEDRDGDVVESAVPARDLAAQSALQGLGHPDEDAGLLSLRHSASSELLLAEYHPCRSCDRTASTRWTTVIHAVAVSR